MEETREPSKVSRRNILPLAASFAAGCVLVGVAGLSMNRVSGPVVQPAIESFTDDAGTKTSGTPAVNVAESDAMSPEAVVAALTPFTARYNLEVAQVLPQTNGVYPVIVTENKRASVIFVSADGLIIAGNLFSLKDGMDVKPEGLQTALQSVQERLSIIDFAALEAQIQNVAAVTVAKGGPEIYMFYEPHCGYCMMNHAELSKHALTVHYIPVSFLSEDSLAIAGVMLNTPAEEAEALMSSVAQRGAQTKFAKDGAQYREDEQVKVALERNNALMREMGINGTPAFFYKLPDGTWKSHNGVLQGPALESLLTQLSG